MQQHHDSLNRLARRDEGEDDLATLAVTERAPPSSRQGAQNTSDEENRRHCEERKTSGSRTAHKGEADSPTLVVRFCTIGEDLHSAIHSSCSLLTLETRKGKVGWGKVPSDAATARQTICEERGFRTCYSFGALFHAPDRTGRLRSTQSCQQGERKRSKLGEKRSQPASADVERLWSVRGMILQIAPVSDCRKECKG